MKRNGFTLIELLLVLAIIGIIAAVAVPVLFGPKVKGTTYRMSIKELATTFGPPERVERVGDITFVYYKQYDGRMKVYTCDRFSVLKEEYK